MKINLRIPETEGLLHRKQCVLMDSLIYNQYLLLTARVGKGLVYIATFSFSCQGKNNLKKKGGLQDQRNGKS